MFNSGSTGSRPLHDGLSVAAFQSGVSIISIEATEHVGAIIVWRKDQRTESGGEGARRGGLGQTIGIEAREDYDFYINTISDRIDNSARGRNRGGIGGARAVDLAKRHDASIEGPAVDPKRTAVETEPVRRRRLSRPQGRVHHG